MQGMHPKSSFAKGCLGGVSSSVVFIHVAEQTLRALCDSVPRRCKSRTVSICATSWPSGKAVVSDLVAEVCASLLYVTKGRAV